MVYIENWKSNDGDEHVFCSDCHVELALLRYGKKIIWLGNCKHFQWRKLEEDKLDISDKNIAYLIFKGKYVYILKLKQK